MFWTDVCNIFNKTMLTSEKLYGKFLVMAGWYIFNYISLNNTYRVAASTHVVRST